MHSDGKTMYNKTNPHVLYTQFAIVISIALSTYLIVVIADTLKFVQVSNKIKEVLTFRSAELHKKNMMMYKNESQECCACVLQNLKAESIFFKKI